MKKKLIVIGILAITLMGCGKPDINNKSKLTKFESGILNSTKNDEDERDMQIKDNGEDKANVQEKNTDNSQQTTTKKQEKKSNNKSSKSTSSSQSNSGKVPSSNGQSQQEVPKQDATQQQEQEKPVIPEPSQPACDDTIPVNGYLNEEDAANYAESTIMDNLLNGDGNLSGYKLETAQTSCGTIYYILTIY